MSGLVMLCTSSSPMCSAKISAIHEATQGSMLELEDSPFHCMDGWWRENHRSSVPMPVPGNSVSQQVASSPCLEPITSR